MGLSPYPENKIILSDARDLDPLEKEAVHDSKMIVCTIENILKHIDNDESIYLHFDTDIIDAPEEMPALKYHVPQGPSVAEMHSLFKSLKDKNIIAVSVSTWHEEKDVDNKTAKACLSLLADLEIDIG